MRARACWGFGFQRAVYIGDWCEATAILLGWYSLMSYQQQILISTKGHGDIHDLTEQVATLVTSSGTQTGTVNIFNVFPIADQPRGTENEDQSPHDGCSRLMTGTDFQ